MRLSQTVSKLRELDVVFDHGGILHVKYKPLDMTVEELAKVQDESDSKDVTRVVDQFLQLVKAWDLTEEDDTPIPLERDHLLKLSINIFSKVISAVVEDQKPSDAEKKR